MATIIENSAPPPQAVDTPVVRPLISLTIIGLIALGILYLVPRPAAISPQGWKMLAIFVCTIAPMMLRPIARTLSTIYESHPGPTASLLGTFLMLAIYQGDMVACAMFLTGQASNPIAADLALKGAQVSMTWSRWLYASIVPGLAAFAIVP